LFAFGLLFACKSAPPVQLHQRSASPVADDYEKILAENTRRAQVYDFMENKVDLRATYHSPAFKQAFSTARSGFYGRSAEHIENVLMGREPKRDPIQDFSKVLEPFQDPDKRELKANEVETFFVAFYSTDQNYRSLDADDSIWDTKLFVDGGEAHIPVKIKQLRRDPSLDQIYPYLAKLDQIYLMSFRAQDEAGRDLFPAGIKGFTLQVVSKLADAKLVWKVKG